MMKVCTSIRTVKIVDATIVLNSDHVNILINVCNKYIINRSEVISYKEYILFIHTIITNSMQTLFFFGKYGKRFQ